MVTEHKLEFKDNGHHHYNGKVSILFTLNATTLRGRLNTYFIDNFYLLISPIMILLMDLEPKFTINQKVRINVYHLSTLRQSL